MWAATARLLPRLNNYDGQGRAPNRGSELFLCARFRPVLSIPLGRSRAGHAPSKLILSITPSICGEYPAPSAVIASYALSRRIEAAPLRWRVKIYTVLVAVLEPSGYGMDSGLPILCEITIYTIDKQGNKRYATFICYRLGTSGGSCGHTHKRQKADPASPRRPPCRICATRTGDISASNPSIVALRSL